jgi:predicted RNA binding protein YcfA (HicA-like mRNA interferase family)
MSEKTPRLTSKDMIRILKKKGFIEFRTKGSHITMVHVEKKLKTIVPYHQGHILPIGTMKSIIEAAEISIDELRLLL